VLEKIVREEKGGRDCKKDKGQSKRRMKEGKRKTKKKKGPAYSSPVLITKG
jgi:hypothetical protein